MRALLGQFRFGLRLLGKSPGHSLASVLALGLGIGLTTTTFSIVYGAALRGLPFDRSEQLLHLEMNNLAKGEDSLEVFLPDFLAWRERQKSFVGLAAFYEGTLNLSHTGRAAERYDGAFMSSNALDLLKVRPLLGRGFRPGEDRHGALAVVLLGYTVWQERYGADPEIVGRPVRMNGEAATIVGVMPPGFSFPVANLVWAPLRLDPSRNNREQGTTLEVFGRLQPGANRDQAAAEIAAITHALAQEFPATNKGFGATVKPYTEEFIGTEARALLFTMLGAVFCVLLIACTNVANLMLARAIARTKELAIRTALGAKRLQVMFQVLLESCLLSLLGAGLGIALAWAGTRWFSALVADTRPPFWMKFALEWPVLLFVALITIFAGICSGLVAALRATRVDVAATLKEEGRGATGLRIGRLSQSIVIAEVALSALLLVIAGLMTKSIIQMRNLDLGLELERRLTARIGLFDSVYPTDADKARFFERLIEGLERESGVVRAAVTSSLPTSGAGREPFELEGQSYPTEQDRPRACAVSISPGYFRTLGSRPVAGREFERLDRPDTEPVALVNQAFAAKYFDGQDPIGRRIRVAGADGAPPWRTVVGVAPNLKDGGFDSDATQETVYLPLVQRPQPFMSLVVETRSDDPLAQTAAVRRQVAAIDPDLPIYWVYTLPQVLSNSSFFHRMFGTLFIIFGAAALVLAAVGIYGVLAFSVSQRTQEIGVRMAIGAQARSVLGLILRQGGLQVAYGLLLGLAAGLGAARLVANILYDVQPGDPAIFILTGLTLSGVALVACYFPARRASRIDPIVALRYE